VSSSVHGVQRFSAGMDIDCGLAAALYARLVLHTWSWADTLMLHVSDGRHETAGSLHHPAQFIFRACCSCMTA
jgi:hypothetical protein